MSKIGNKYGKLTVIDQSPYSLKCICECGKIGMHTYKISQPTYTGRKSCDICAGRPCEICNKWVAASSGRQSFTCSDECRKERFTKRERERYHLVKDTEHWQNVRKKYFECIKALRAEDKELDAKMRAYKRETYYRHIKKVRSDPVLLKKYREIAKKEWQRIKSDPLLHAKHMEAMRRWYGSLTDEDKERIYKAPDRERKAKKRAQCKT
jgi:hypothetical protein